MNERDLAKVSMVRKNRHKGGSQGSKKRALPRVWGRGQSNMLKDGQRVNLLEWRTDYM